ncbi:MAG TPA: tRNA modification GTPase [Tepidisphaeraceae bacterium]|nr:tRNA modification GTPase [Tepidisphaeraceae bacterium]
MNSGDTIAAFSSPVAQAARIILRLSGPGAIEMAGRLTEGELPKPSSAARMNLRVGELKFPAWVYLFGAPRSYTGEDLVEFHLPGNPLLAQMTLQQLLRAGARLADAGEFTARAYFNGRIDLTEAEGIAATIHASNQQELSAARQLMAGELLRRVEPIIDEVAHTLALVEAGIDFSDEDVSFLSPQQASERIAKADRALEDLLRDSARFERLSHEPTFVLVGRPNAGKSTLLNALAGQERAIVSPVPGTTRDVLSAPITLARGVIHLIDVAGIEHADEPPQKTVHDSHRHIHRQMQEHAIRAARTADRLILLRDITQSDADPMLPRPPDLAVLTKADLADPACELRGSYLAVSARNGTGINELRAVLDELAFGATASSAKLALNARHVQSIEEARTALSQAANQTSATPELLAMELREALDALGRIAGRVTPDDVLGRVFSTFCIGK